jgi:hypothetical protein
LGGLGIRFFPPLLRIVVVLMLLLYLGLSL